MSNRKPYPFPQLQNDEDFTIGCGSTQKIASNVPNHLAQKQEPWNRLNCTKTLASERREIFSYDENAPHDSLDFILDSDFNQHKEFLKDKNETLLQPLTIGKPHNRQLKNKTKLIPDEKPSLNHPLQKNHVPKKENANSTNKAIEGHHKQTTNRGYSRKPDGGFFTS